MGAPKLRSKLKAMSVIFKPVEVRALPNYKLWLRYSDGVVGEVDLSQLVGKGVFELWSDDSNFERVIIGPHGELVWSDEVDMCTDALYLQLTGKRPEEVFPNLRADYVDA